MQRNQTIKILLLLISITCLLITNPLTSKANELKPFTSDGCSAFPDGTYLQNQLWLKCCKTHDFTYWQGGTYQQRLDADNELKACVSGVGEPEIALLMLAGVRVGGTPFLPTTFRWSYGWPYPKFYGKLNTQERKQIQDSINRNTSTNR